MCSAKMGHWKRFHKCDETLNRYDHLLSNKIDKKKSIHKKDDLHSIKCNFEIL